MNRTTTEDDALIRQVLQSTMPNGSPISHREKADAILSIYLTGEVPPGLRRLVALGIGKSARDARRKGA